MRHPLINLHVAKGEIDVPSVESVRDVTGRTLSRSLAIVYRSLVELKANPNNPRSHSAKQVRQIAKSIDTFGFNVPVLVDADLNVIAGHGRVLAC
jgi:hypothetical protein